MLVFPLEKVREERRKSKDEEERVFLLLPSSKDNKERKTRTYLYSSL